MTAQIDWIAPMPRPALLADTPRARNTDPESSHTAAQKVKASGALGCQQAAVLAAVKQWPGMTAVELAHLGKMDRYAVSRRLPELCPVHVRRGEIRDCSVNARPQVTWWLA